MHPDAFTRILAAFDSDPGLVAVFGSYDDHVATTGVVSPAGIGSATGILVAGASGATVRGNRINGLVPSAEPNVCGICAGSPEVIIEGNTVSGPGVVGSVGIYCEYSTATATRNTIARSFTCVSTCWEFENAVNPN